MESVFSRIDIEAICLSLEIPVMVGNPCNNHLDLRSSLSGVSAIGHGVVNGISITGMPSCPNVF
jgi:hypothetical protein